MKEYKVISVKQTELENKMNEMAKEGWEVVSVCRDFEKLGWHAYLLVTFCKVK